MITRILTLFALTACSSIEKTEEETQWDEHVFSVNCEALEAHFVTTATSSVDDWTGYWECFQEENNCQGTSCSWSVSDLPDYVVNESCEDAGSCTIGNETVSECAVIENTGSVSFACSDDNSVITANGLPDHTFENYAQSGQLPPLLGSSENNTEYTVSAAPVYRADSEIFEMGGGTIAVAVNGVSIFNQFTGTGLVAVEDEIVDDCGGHPANGNYHYHAWPKCGELSTSDRMGADGSHSGLVGLSVDGFPVFGPFGYDDGSDDSSSVVRMNSCYTLSACDDITSSDCYGFDDDAYSNGNCHLDRCNGRVTAVPSELQDALGEEIYAYYMTLDESGEAAFPYQPYCYRGDISSNGDIASGPPLQ